MGVLDYLPHGFLLIILVVVGFFILKSLIKFAIIVGAVGLLVYLLWVNDLLPMAAGA